MNRVISVILVVAASLFLSACKDSYTDELKVESNGIELADGTLINLAGQEAYNEQCASCHALDGNGTSAGSSLVGCATCGDIAELTSVIERTMPIGNVGKCSGTCASDTAEYIFYAFNVQNIEETEITLQQITTEPAEVTLRRASLQLSGALPSNTASIAVATSEEEALSAAIDGILSTDAFYDILVEMFNKKFLTDKYLTSIGGRGVILALIDKDDFPNKDWYQSYSSSAVERCALDQTNDAIAREPLELVRHIAENNLPLTQLVEADYTMVNWYSMQTYGAELIVSGEFNQLDSPVCSGGDENVYYDPNDFRPARVNHDLEFESGGVKHAGLLTMPAFLNRYPTTATNVNRHRSRTVFDYFLDTDIMAINGGSRDSDSAGIGEGDIPTLSDPNCTVCHDLMDPVSSMFQNWTATGRYIRANSNSANIWDNSSILSPGFNGTDMPGFSPSEDAPSGMLQWLGTQLASDPRYARAMVRIVYEGVFGEQLLLSPSDNSSQEEKDAFNIQRAWVNEVAGAFKNANWNIKTLVKSILMSSYYRAESIDIPNEILAAKLGASQLLSPEALQRKLQATLGFGWDDLRSLNNRMMFGGMNSDDVTEELKDPSGIMVAMQKRMAVEMGCRATSYNLALPVSERKLFRSLEYTTLPVDDSGEEIPEHIAMIKSAIAELMWSLYGERVSAESSEVSAAYELYRSLLSLHQEAPAGRYLSCRATNYFNADGSYGGAMPDSQKLEYDNDYNVHAWTGVMVYLLSDFRFVFE